MDYHQAKLCKICLLSDLTAVMLFWFQKIHFLKLLVIINKTMELTKPLLNNNQSYQPLHQNAGCV